MKKATLCALIGIVIQIIAILVYCYGYSTCYYEVDKVYVYSTIALGIIAWCLIGYFFGVLYKKQR